jgi:predicted acyltransferase
MLVVNNVALGDFTPATLGHADWAGGITLADLVFPWFLFMVGLSFPFSLVGGGGTTRRIWTRGRNLFLWGLLLTMCIERRPAFALGVLQLIGMSYVAAALIYRWHHRAPDRNRMLWASCGLLAIYFVFARFYPFPGGPSFEEGNNVFRWVNGFLAPYRLNGLLSIIPTTPLILFGAACAHVLRSEDAPERQHAILLRWGLIACVVGAALSWVLPFNKPVWTPPYILVTGGLGCLLLAALDRWLRFRGPLLGQTWLLAIGSNALLAYVLPIVVKVGWWNVWTLPSPSGGREPMTTAVLLWLRTPLGELAGGLLYTVAYVTMWCAIVVACTRRGWRLRA